MTIPTPSSPPPPIVLVFDASALVAWVLQTQSQWKKVEKLFGTPATLAVPASALTETIYICRKKGNTSTPEQLRQALVAQGLRIEPIAEDDAELAGDLISKSHDTPAAGNKTLSLGDGLVLAVNKRLNGTAVTFDKAWWQFPSFISQAKLFDPSSMP